MPTHNEALLEAHASCPPSARIYYTLELWQSSFDQPARVVANVGDDMAFGLEAGAPRNAGETVTFIACPFEAGYPEQKEGQPPSTTIKIDNVNASWCRRSARRRARANISRCFIASTSAAT
ncbi:DUF1833 family protein [Bradyrhizobium sp. BRP56]|uniref:DUF1833 family protein n=1 Tax=Bradyrhizobium sp. BRP56 TaxID=2793819 RepID=UPI0023EE5310|nr:DUF1833 family protein [Bradyrhizobium sp. BRP56]MCA1400200.1 DUF1833 family protein [Bradyrhizobium sp. BRP56]